MATHGSIKEWLKAACRYPLLTADEELQLGSVIQAGRQEGATPRQKRAAQRATNRLVSCNLRLVVAASKKFVPRLQHHTGMEMCDLLQEMTLGLHRAAEKFEPKRGYKFSTYAYWWLRQAAQRAIDQSGVIKTPTNVVCLAQKLHFLPAGLTRAEKIEALNIEESTFKLVERHLEIRSVRSFDVAASNRGDDEAQGIHEFIGQEGLTLDEIATSELLDQVLAVAEDKPQQLEHLIRVAVNGERISEIARQEGSTFSSVRHGIHGLRMALRKRVPNLAEALTA